MVLTIRVVSIEAANENMMIVMMILTNYSKENQFFLFIVWQHLLVRHVLDVMHIEKMFVRASMAHYFINLKRRKMGSRLEEI